MEFIKKIQHRLHDRMLRKQLSESSPTRKSVSLKEADYIGILFNATLLEDRKVVEAYQQQLKNANKKVLLLGFLNEKENQSNFTFGHFNNQDLNWIGKNKSELVESFVREKFDLLICLNEDQCLFDIAMRSSASLRIGSSAAKEECFDLMIDKGHTSTIEFIKHIEFFLNKMNSKENV